MYSYKNVSKLTVRVAGVGRVEAGKRIDSAFELNHPWLERVEKGTTSNKPKKDT